MHTYKHAHIHTHIYKHTYMCTCVGVFMLPSVYSIFLSVMWLSDLILFNTLDSKGKHMGIYNSYSVYSLQS